MKKTSRYLLYIFAAILLSRLFLMFIIPLTDTTEARYAEMARIMAETNDWITPYIDYNIPFWGKPPLSFWLQAVSINIFGINEFAPRFPSLLMELAVIALIFKLLSTVANTSTAVWGMLIYASGLLVYSLSGAVLTDPFLTLGSTLSFVAFIMVLKEKERYWGYLFFVGLSIGFLSKGPLVLVLTGGTIGLWLLLSTKRWRVFKLYPWITGIILTLLLTLPWYVMAELKTPGFLNYFILGEHFYRFVDSGWAGDLYGTAHKHAHGVIWLHWAAASLPWGIIALGILFKRVFAPNSLKQLREEFAKEDISFYVIWALFPMLFFTLSRNILWTYVLPAMPALAILLALYLYQKKDSLTARYRNLFISAILFIPVLAMGAVIFVYKNDNILSTEKFLVEKYAKFSHGEKPLYCLKKKNFSMRFYTKGKAKEITMDELRSLISKSDDSLYLSVPNDMLASVHQLYSVKKEELYKNKRFVLIKITAENIMDK